MQVIEHRQVVGRQIPEDVDVAPDDAEVGAHGVVVPGRPELSRVEQVLDGADRRTVHEGVIHHEDQPPLPALLEQDPGFDGPARERLFHQHMLVGAERGEGQLEMSPGRCGNGDCIDGRVGHDGLPVVAEASPSMGHRRQIQALAGWVADGREPDTLGGVQDPGEVGTPVAVAQHSNLDH